MKGGKSNETGRKVIYTIELISSASSLCGSFLFFRCPRRCRGEPRAGLVENSGQESQRTGKKARCLRWKESNIIQKHRKLFPDAKVSPFYITGNGPRETLVAGKLHLRDNFSNYYQMANGQSLCFSRPASWSPAAGSSRSLEEGDSGRAAQYRW